VVNLVVLQLVVVVVVVVVVHGGAVVGVGVAVREGAAQSAICRK
jgi:hypothetical protein